MGFPSNVAEQALVACARRCCICHKFCGFKIELHRITQKADGGEDTFENCIPLCFDCHADVKAYNLQHPKGRKYSESELKKHRNRWYARVSGNSDWSISSIQKRDIEPGECQQICADNLIDNLPDSFNCGGKNETQRPIKFYKVEYPENTLSPIDYSISSSTRFQERIILLTRQIETLKQEQDSAKKLGLRGVATTVEADIDDIEETIQVLQQRVEIIERGYGLWERDKFQTACEERSLQDNWYYLGSIEGNGTFIGSEDISIRIPQEVQNSLKAAIASGLFLTFGICETIKTRCTNIGDLILEDAFSCGCYLLGSPSDDASEIFLVAHWVFDEIDLEIGVNT